MSGRTLNGAPWTVPLEVTGLRTAHNDHVWRSDWFTFWICERCGMPTQNPHGSRDLNSPAPYPKCSMADDRTKQEPA